MSAPFPHGLAHVGSQLLLPLEANQALLEFLFRNTIAIKPLGGSMVIFMPFWSTDMGNSDDGIDVLERAVLNALGNQHVRQRLSCMRSLFKALAATSGTARSPIRGHRNPTPRAVHSTAKTIMIL